MFAIHDIFLRIHFYSKKTNKTFLLSVSWLFIVRDRPIKTFADVHLIKVGDLDSAHGAAALMGGHNSEEDVSEICNCGRKGTSSPHCQHLIRSGIKHFVTVQAEQRGRDIG